MSTDRQYFDDLIIEDNNLWAVDNACGTKTPLRFQSVGTSQITLSGPFEIVINQVAAAPWYCRRNFITEAAAKSYADNIVRLAHEADAMRWQR